MKSRHAGGVAVLVLALATVGGPAGELAKAAGFGDGPSFREQLCQLVYQRESGLISESTYWFRRQQINGVMLH